MHRSPPRTPVYLRGFTLVELMVTVAVIALLAAVAVPGMTALIRNSRVKGQAEEMVATLQLARSEAVRRNTAVTVCASANGTTCAASTAWARVIVHGMDNTAAVPVDDVIRDSTVPGTVQISGPAAGIRFLSSGMTDAAQVQVTTSGESRYVCVLISGLVSVKKVAC